MKAKHPKAVTVAHELLAKAPVIRIAHSSAHYHEVVRGHVRKGRQYALVPFMRANEAANQLTRADARTRLDPSRRKSAKAKRAKKSRTRR